jgi:hypothetical protein
MPFTSANRIAIAEVLNLERHQRTESSRLQTLLRDVEVFDAQYGDAVVAQVQRLLERIDALQVALYGDPDEDLDLGLTANDGISSVSIPGELSITRSPSGVQESTAYTNKLAALKAKLKDLIDPQDVLGAVTEGGNILF